MPDFDPHDWDPSAHKEAAENAEWRGSILRGLWAAQRLHLDWDLDRDGCPWGWVQCNYAAEVASYVGRRDTRSPVRSLNVRLLGQVMRDAAEPTELLEAVQQLENWEDSAYAQFRQMVDGA